MRTIIEMLFTNSCNRNCPYCVAKSRDRSYRGQQQKNNEHGDYKLESGIINIVQAKKWLMIQKGKLEDIQIVISGGEPTLLRHWTEFLDWLRSNGFKKPILYTNGVNLRDLLDCEGNPKDLAKILLTHHLDGNEDVLRENVRFLEDLGMNFIVKLLTKGKDMRALGDSLGCRYVVEGLRELYSEDLDELMHQRSEYNPLDGSSPFRWRWDGYGDLIDRNRTEWKPAVVLTIDPTGLIWNCHIFNEPSGSIYEPGKELENLQMAWCPYWDTYNQETMECKETRCEMQHYVNIMEDDYAG